MTENQAAIDAVVNKQQYNQPGFLAFLFEMSLPPLPDSDDSYLYERT